VEPERQALPGVFRGLRQSAPVEQYPWLDAELKRDADLSGNPKIWTAAEFSQEFLMELIPK
jgi:hypothetical protein